MLSHIGGDDKACLKTVQAINKGMLLTDTLVSGSREIALSAFCLQRALGWSWSLRRKSRLRIHVCQRSPSRCWRRCRQRYGTQSVGKHRSAAPQHCFPPQNQFSKVVSVVTPQIGKLRCRKMQWCVQGCPGWQSEVLPGVPGHHPANRGPWPIYQSKVFEGSSHPLLSQLGAQHCWAHCYSLEDSTSHSCSSHHVLLAESLH